MRVMPVCGESSGDLLAAELVQALQKTPQFADAEFFGLYGEACEAFLPPSLFPLSALSVMGIAEVIPKFFALRRLAAQVTEAALARADVVIFVDSFAFTHPIAKRLREQNPKIKLIRYVAPKLWAWAPGRAKKLRGVYDLILGLFDFEPEFFAQYQIPVRFAGHPAINRSAQAGTSEKIAAFDKKYGFTPQDRIVTLLPGSRKSEVRALRPLFLTVAEALCRDESGLTFATVTPRIAGLAAPMSSGKDFPLVSVDPEDRFTLFLKSYIALAASGTVSLELTVAGVPHLIAYRVSPITAFIARRLVRIPYAALTNIIADRLIIPEFIQEKCTFLEIYAGITPYLSAESSSRSAMLAAFDEVKRRLVTENCDDPARQAAEYICEIYSSDT